MTKLAAYLFYFLILSYLFYFLFEAECLEFESKLKNFDSDLQPSLAPNPLISLSAITMHKYFVQIISHVPCIDRDRPCWWPCVGPHARMQAAAGCDDESAILFKRSKAGNRQPRRESDRSRRKSNDLPVACPPVHCRASFLPRPTSWLIGSTHI